MSQQHKWNIRGDNALAQALREAARYVDTDQPITVVTEGGQADPDAFAVGSAVLSTTSERYVPFYSAFEAVEEIKRTLDAGDAGKVYGCFTSFRVVRGSPVEVLNLNALLPAVGLTLDLLPGQVTRIYAKRASLFAGDDAWFVTLRYEDDTIATIEAMAVTQPTTGMELLVEVTGSDRVLRAEPTRQAVIVERAGSLPRYFPWWEDLLERYLRLVVERSALPQDSAGSRFRSIWTAIHESARSGQAVSLQSSRHAAR